tara:strand:- start:689 stop:1216 length:528 start_codon:yes stop_codon:yes gene_type:complete
MSTTTEEYRVYVACLASYNNGNLYGKWLSVSGKSGEEIQEEIDEILKESPEPGAEEWAIRDHEFGKILGNDENPDLDSLGELAELLEEHGEAFKFYAENLDQYQSATRQDFEDTYRGHWDKESDYAYDFHESMGDIDQSHPLTNHIDWESVWNDMRHGSCWSAHSSQGGYHIYER